MSVAWKIQSFKNKFPWYKDYESIMAKRRKKKDWETYNHMSNGGGKYKGKRWCKQLGGVWGSSCFTKLTSHWFFFLIVDVNWHYSTLTCLHFIIYSYYRFIIMVISKKPK